MKILVFDTRFPKGHKDLNNHLVTILAQKYELIVMNNSNFYTVSHPNIRYVNVDVKEYSGNSVLLNQISHFKNIISAYSTIRKESYDVILFQTFDISSFLLCLILFPFKNKYLFYHNNADQLYRRLKRYCFNMFKNRVYHLAFSKCIADYLIDLGAPSHRVMIIPHPIPLRPPYDVGNKKFICGLSNSNDDATTNAIFDYEEKYSVLKELGLKLILRTNIRRENEMIEIVDRYLSYEEYFEYFSHSKGVLLILPPDYKYRYSGVIKDALAFGKVVYVSSSIISEDFSRLYPHNVRVFKTIEQLFQLLSQNIDFSSDEDIRFLNYHSDKNILKSFDMVFPNTGCG